MAFPLLQVVDDAGSVLFDLNDATGANNPFGVITEIETLDLGTAAISLATRPAYGSLDGAVTSQDIGFRRVNAGLVVEGATADQSEAAIGLLGRYLNEGRRLRWQANAASLIWYVQTLAVEELPSALRSAANAHILNRDFVAGASEPVQISVLAQGALQRDPLLASVNKLTNSLLMVEGATAGRPLNWAWLSATNISAESLTDDGYNFTIATTAARSLQQTTAVGSFAPGNVVTHSFYVKASAASIVRARAAVQFKQADGTTNVGSEHVGTLTAIGTDEVRVTVTTAAAGALTSRALVSLRFENSVATSVGVEGMTKAQTEVGATASEYRMGAETLVNDPAGFCVLPVWNPGDTDARADIVLSNESIDWSQIMVALYDGAEVADFINGGYLIPSSDAINGLEADFADTTRTTSISGASEGDAITTTFVSGATLVKRMFYDAISATQRCLVDRPVAVFGRFAKTDISPLSIFQARLNAYHGAGTPANQLDLMTFDASAETTFHDLYLGRGATLRESSVWELSLARTGGSGSLRTDCLYMVPLSGMVVVDSSSNETVKLNAHAENSAVCTDPADTSVHNGVAAVQGNIPIIPPGLSALMVRVWSSASEREPLANNAKESTLADTITAWVDITPQR